jgi:hypothetical protein
LQEDLAGESTEDAQEEDVHYEIAPLNALEASSALDTAARTVEVRPGPNDSTPRSAILMPNQEESPVPWSWNDF